MEEPTEAALYKLHDTLCDLHFDLLREHLVHLDQLTSLSKLLGFDNIDLLDVLTASPDSDLRALAVSYKEAQERYTSAFDHNRQLKSKLYDYKQVLYRIMEVETNNQDKRERQIEQLQLQLYEMKKTKVGESPADTGETQHFQTLLSYGQTVVERSAVKVQELITPMKHHIDSAQDLTDLLLTDRAEVADSVFKVFRHKEKTHWRMTTESEERCASTLQQQNSELQRLENMCKAYVRDMR